MQEPMGRRSVTRDEFFAALYADPRDIMPRIRHERRHQEHGYTSDWKTANGAIFGVSRGVGAKREYWLVSR